MRPRTCFVVYCSRAFVAGNVPHASSAFCAYHQYLGVLGGMRMIMGRLDLVLRFGKALAIVRTYDHYQ
jgi:hypothetical protein